MLFIDKNSDIKEINDDIVSVIQGGLARWNSIPEGDLNASHTKIIRKEFFDQLKKQKIRDSLYEEQHGLCAYCMLQLNNHPLHMTIEHFRPLSKNKNLAMDYHNFLGVCKGGQDVTPEEGEKRIICCDARKGDNAELTVDPQNREMMELIAYKSNGEIYFLGNDTWKADDIYADLTDILYLNGERSKDGSLVHDTTTCLVKGRKDAYKAAQTFILKSKEKGLFNVEWLEKQIAIIENMPVREEFAGVKLFVYKRTKKSLELKNSI